MMDGDKFYGYLRMIEGYLWIADTTSLLLIIILCCRRKEISSISIALGVIAFIGFISLKYGILLVQTNPKIPKTELQLWLGEHEQVKFFFWYVGFITLDCLALYLIELLHRSADVIKASISRLVAFAFYTHGFVSFFRYLERSWFGTDYLKYTYSFTIAAIGIGTSLVCLLFVLRSLREHYIDRNYKEGV